MIALNAVAPQTEADAARQFIENFRLAKGPDSPFEELAWQKLGNAVAAIPRLRADKLSARMANNSNHRKAQMATPPLTADDLAAIRAPALILHGTADPIFPPDHAQWSASRIPDARLRLIPKMGHALDPAFFGPITGELEKFLARQKEIAA